MPVEVRILGPLEVICGGRGVPIRGGKERALVVRLALGSGRAVSPQLLVEALWDGEPPASVDASVRVLLSRIRKALAAVGADDIIRTRPPGYVLSVDEIDAVRFEMLSARGRGQLADGRPDLAASTLTDALALWRGDTLAEVGSEYLRLEAARLDQTRLSVLEDRIAADLACGRHSAVHAELAALCRTHPLREGLWALWITALYRCSRQAEALAAYQELKVVLAGELGIDPSPRLQQLEVAVLAQDPMLAPLLAGMTAEASQPRMGGATILSRMAELLTARLIRCWVDCTDNSTTGWLAAIRDIHVGRALAAIHRDPSKNWTLETLARVAGQSRSVFAERFSMLLGEGPAHYAARWRMRLAQEWLRQQGTTTADAAFRLGYESEASFARAFKRVTGQSPGAVRREVSGRNDMVFGQ